MTERTIDKERHRDQSVYEAYHERTPTSRKHYTEACEYMPGGNTRGVLYYPPYPAYLTEGDGATVTDVDGNTYLDFLNNYTTLIHGHADRQSAEAAIRAIRRSSAPGGPTPDEVDWARHLVTRAPAVEQIRFTNSGTEATMNAVRAARAYTGNEVIAKFEGAYHGTHDDVQISVHPPSHLAGPEDRPSSVPDSAGLPASKHEEVLTLPFNRTDATLRRLQAVKDDLAGVIIAPYLGSSVIPLDESFIEAVAEWTTTHDIPLIFDEVISFRVAHGGAHAAHDITPDLVTYGKLIGGGFAVGAFGGREALMAPYDPRGGSDVVHSGTFNANPVTAAAGLAALEKFDADEVVRLNQLAATLVSNARDVIADHSLNLQVTQIGSLFNIYLTPHEVETARDKTAPEELEHHLYHELLSEGIRVAPKLLGCLSTPMTEEDIDTFVSGLDAALSRFRSTLEVRAPELIA